MAREQKLWLRFSGWLKIRLVQRLPRTEVGPTVPRPGVDFEHRIACPPDRPTSAIVITVVGHVEFAIWCEGQAEWIAKAPSNQLHGPTPGRDLHDSAAAWHSSFNHLAGSRCRAERRERSGGSPSLTCDNIGRLKIRTSQDNVFAGNVMKFWVPLEPSEFSIVLAHDCGIRRRALSKIDRAIWANRWTIGVMIADAWQTGDNRTRTAAGRDAQDSSAFRFAPFGYIERSVGMN